MKKFVKGLIVAGLLLTNVTGFGAIAQATQGTNGEKERIVVASKKVTAGRDALGRFAPQFAALNDDVLFGEVWSREEQLSPRERSLITVTALMTSGILDSSLSFHLSKAKENGVTKAEIAEVLTQLGFYSGWPKAWAAFRLAQEVWTD